MDSVAVGKAIETLSAKLSNQNYVFSILLIFSVGAVGYFLVSQSVFVSLCIFALAPMLLLFNLLTPEYRPQGWEPQWTFYLFMSYVMVTILVIVLAFTALLHATEIDLSAEYERNWQTSYQDKFTRYTSRIVDQVKTV